MKKPLKEIKEAWQNEYNVFGKLIIFPSQMLFMGIICIIGFTGCLLEEGCIQLINIGYKK